MRKRILAFLLCLVMISTITPSLLAVYEDRPGETLLYNFTFAPEDKAEYEEMFTPNKSVEIEWVSSNGIGHGDDHALRVKNIDENFTSVDNVVRLTLSDPLPLGYEYRVVAWIYAPSDGNAGKSNMQGPNICINNNYEGALGVSKFPSDYGRLTIGEWRIMDAEIPIQTADIEVIDFRLYTNNDNEHPNVWYWDNIEIWQGARDESIRVPEWDMTLPSLAETYKNYFPVGNIMSPGNLWMRTHSDAFLHHYNTVTAENAMKPVYVALQSGQYDFANADTIVDYARENNISVHGHALIWHEQSADWLAKDANGNPLTREAARDNMEAYITAYAGRYAGKVASWDVVNEAFDNSVGGGGWQNGLRKNAPFYRAYDNYSGDDDVHPSDYIYDAFVFTRLAAPDAILFYNEFNEEQSDKRLAIVTMAEDLNERWETDPRNTEPGRLLIEGIGMQSHYWVDELNPANVRSSIERFVEAGLRIRVTELDIPFGSWSRQRSADAPPPSEAELTKQANLYSELFKIYVEFAEHIDAVTIWGLADPLNWRGNGLPVLFDEFFELKPAYWAVIGVADPGAYNRYHGIEEPEPSPDPLTPAPVETPEPSPAQGTQPGDEEDSDSSFPWWGFVLIGAGVLILVVILLVTIKRNKKGDT